jgi:protein arginine N-methyltransferase 1
VPGDRIVLALKAHLVGNDYLWRWNTQIFAQGNPNTIKAHYQQSTFYSTLLSPMELRKRSDQFRPQLSRTGKIDLTALSLMEQGYSLGEIAQQLTEQFNNDLPTWKAALTHLGELSQRYST